MQVLTPIAMGEQLSVIDPYISMATPKGRLLLLAAGVGWRTRANNRDRTTKRALKEALKDA